MGDGFCVGFFTSCSVFGVNCLGGFGFYMVWDMVLGWGSYFLCA